MTDFEPVHEPLDVKLHVGVPSSFDRIVSIRNFDFRSSLITWIYKITVNECYDYLRKKKVRKLVYESDLSEDEVRRVKAQAASNVASTT